MFETRWGTIMGPYGLRCRGCGYEEDAHPPECNDDPEEVETFIGPIQDTTYTTDPSILF